MFHPMRHPVPHFMHTPCTTICLCRATVLLILIPCCIPYTSHTHAMRYGIRIDIVSSYITWHTYTMRNTVRNPVPFIFIRMPYHTAYAWDTQRNTHLFQVRHDVLNESGMSFSMRCTHHMTRYAITLHRNKFESKRETGIDNESIKGEKVIGLEKKLRR